MTRLIDADALNEKLCKTTIFIKDGEVFQRMINDAPTVSAEAEQVTGKLNKRDNSLLTDDSEECKEQKSKLDLISRQDAIGALGEEPEIWDDTEEEWAYRNAWVEHISAIESLPSAEPKTDEENELKFYYVESIDDYWIGRRLDNFYYADWHDGLGFVWSKSRYLPWGEHIVDENTLWKEHTYPSEPIEVPFAEWIVGFVKKYFAEPKTGKWVKVIDEETSNVTKWHYECDQCRTGRYENGQRYCHNCGAKMKGGDDE